MTKTWEDESSKKDNMRRGRTGGEGEGCNRAGHKEGVRESGGKKWKENSRRRGRQEWMNKGGLDE